MGCGQPGGSLRGGARRDSPACSSQNGQDMIDVGDGVIGVDLEPDLFVSSGNHGVGKAGRQHAALEEGRHQAAGLFSVAEASGARSGAHRE